MENILSIRQNSAFGNTARLGRAGILAGRRTGSFCELQECFAQSFLRSFQARYDGFAFFKKAHTSHFNKV
ncbi:hypothetical protein [uncultured Neglectibacter sp.]|uniref:hypothetical protein n=1 Tax=uncultured Neglectibacter sp. TaxID=1924108 RepID=UPI0034DFC66B